VDRAKRNKSVGVSTASESGCDQSETLGCDTEGHGRSTRYWRHYAYEYKEAGTVYGLAARWRAGVGKVSKNCDDAECETERPRGVLTYVGLGKEDASAALLCSLHD
jgi:hypothetical protein